MSSLNKVLLVGYVGRDPDVRYFDGGAAVANFPLATSERGYTLPNGMPVPERTEWHNIVVRRTQVAFVERWVKKGSSLFVEGKLHYRSYNDANGGKRYVTEIHADRIEFFSTGSGTSAGGDQTDVKTQDPVSTVPRPPQSAQLPVNQQPSVQIPGDRQPGGTLNDNNAEGLPLSGDRQPVQPFEGQQPGGDFPESNSIDDLPF